jgi:hypothetical protein
MEYTLLLRGGGTTVRYAECPACGVIPAFTVGRRPRAVASFAVDADGVSATGVRLGSAEELVVAERGVRTIAHTAADRPGAAEPAPAAPKRAGGGSKARRTRRRT